MQVRQDTPRGGSSFALIGGIAVVIVVVCAALLYFQYARALSQARDSASRVFAERALTADRQIDSLLDLASSFAQISPLEKGVGEPVTDNGLSHPALDTLKAVVNSVPSSYAAYYGLTDGSFIEAIATHGDPSIVGALRAPAGTMLVVRTVIPQDGQELIQDWTFLDAGGTVVGQRSEANPAYDPRKTSWYQRGWGQAGPLLVKPYVFSSMPVVGITAVQNLPGNRGVFGVDFTLTDLSRFLAEHPVSPNGAMYIFDNSLDLLAAPPSGPNSVPTDKLMSDMRSLGLPLLQALAQLSLSPNVNRPTVMHIQSRDYIALVSQWRGNAAPAIEVGIIAPLDDFTTPVAPAFIRTIAVAAAVLVLAIGLVVWFARRPKAGPAPS